MSSLDAATVVDLIERFGDAWNAHDLDAALALCTEDIVFESTGPAPDGERSEGQAAVRAAWEPIFDNADAQFTTEDMFVAEDRVLTRWRYGWGDGHVRGVDVMRVRDGKVAEKLSYVKG
jgi:ketosteroid isomerase-like protein